MFFFCCFCQPNVNLIKKHLENLRFGGASSILKIPVGIFNTTKIIYLSKLSYRGGGEGLKSLACSGRGSDFEFFIFLVFACLALDILLLVVQE